MSMQRVMQNMHDLKPGKRGHVFKDLNLQKLEAKSDILLFNRLYENEDKVRILTPKHEKKRRQRKAIVMGFDDLNAKYNLKLEDGSTDLFFAEDFQLDEGASLDFQYEELNGGGADTDYFLDSWGMKGGDSWRNTLFACPVLVQFTNRLRQKDIRLHDKWRSALTCAHFISWNKEFENDPIEEVKEYARDMIEKQFTGVLETFLNMQCAVIMEQKEEVKKYILTNRIMIQLEKDGFSELKGQLVEVIKVPVDGIVCIRAEQLGKDFFLPARCIEWDGMYEERYEFVEKLKVSHSFREELQMHGNVTEDNKPRNNDGSEVTLMNISDCDLKLSIVRVQLASGVGGVPDVKVFLRLGEESEFLEVKTCVEKLYHDDLHDIRILEDIEIHPGMPIQMRIEAPRLKSSIFTASRKNSFLYVKAGRGYKRNESGVVYKSKDKHYMFSGSIIYTVVADDERLPLTARIEISDHIPTLDSDEVFVAMDYKGSDLDDSHITTRARTISEALPGWGSSLNAASSDSYSELNMMSNTTTNTTNVDEDGLGELPVFGTDYESQISTTRRLSLGLGTLSVPRPGIPSNVSPSLQKASSMRTRRRRASTKSRRRQFSSYKSRQSIIGTSYGSGEFDDLSSSLSPSVAGLKNTNRKTTPFLTASEMGIDLDNLDKDADSGDNLPSVSDFDELLEKRSPGRQARAARSLVPEKPKLDLNSPSMIEPNSSRRNDDGDNSEPSEDEKWEEAEEHIDPLSMIHTWRSESFWRSNDANHQYIKENKMYYIRRERCTSYGDAKELYIHIFNTFLQEGVYQIFIPILSDPANVWRCLEDALKATKVYSARSSYAFRTISQRQMLTDDLTHITPDNIAQLLEKRIVLYCPDHYKITKSGISRLRIDYEKRKAEQKLGELQSLQVPVARAHANMNMDYEGSDDGSYTIDSDKSAAWYMNDKSFNHVSKTFLASNLKHLYSKHVLRLNVSEIPGFKEDPLAEIITEDEFENKFSLQLTHGAVFQISNRRSEYISIKGLGVLAHKAVEVHLYELSTGNPFDKLEKARNQDAWKKVTSMTITHAFEMQYLKVDIVMRPGERRVFTIHSSEPHLTSTHSMLHTKSQMSQDHILIEPLYRCTSEKYWMSTDGEPGSIVAALQYTENRLQKNLRGRVVSMKESHHFSVNPDMNILRFLRPWHADDFVLCKTRGGEWKPAKIVTITKDEERLRRGMPQKFKIQWKPGTTQNEEIWHAPEDFRLQASSRRKADRPYYFVDRKKSDFMQAFGWITKRGRIRSWQILLQNEETSSSGVISQLWLCALTSAAFVEYGRELVFPENEHILNRMQPLSNMKDLLKRKCPAELASDVEYFVTEIRNKKDEFRSFLLHEKMKKESNDEFWGREVEIVEVKEPRSARIVQIRTLDSKEEVGLFPIQLVNWNFDMNQEKQLLSAIDGMLDANPDMSDAKEFNTSPFTQETLFYYFLYMGYEEAEIITAFGQRDLYFDKGTLEASKAQKIECQYKNGDTVQVLNMPAGSVLYSFDSRNRAIRSAKPWESDVLILGDNEKHFIQWRQESTGKKSQFLLVKTHSCDLSVGSVMVLEHEGLPQDVTVKKINADGTVEVSDIRENRHEKVQIDALIRANTNRFHIFHGNFKNLIHRGCKQFMIKPQSNTVCVYDSTKNSIDMNIEVEKKGETIQAYCYGVYDQKDYIYIATEKSIQRHSLNDLSSTPLIWTRDIEAVGTVGPFMVADETFLYTVNQVQQIVASDMSKHKEQYESVDFGFVPGAKSMTTQITAMIYVQGATQERDLIILGDQSGRITVIFPESKNDKPIERSHPKFKYVQGLVHTNDWLFSGHRDENENGDMLLMWPLRVNAEDKGMKNYRTIYAESVYDLEKTKSKRKEYILSGHQNHIMCWDKDGEPIQRIVFDNQRIDSISFCPSSNALIAGSESGYVEQIQFTQGLIDTYCLGNAATSICMSSKQRLMYCLTSSHLLQIDTDSRKRYKHKKMTHAGGSISLLNDNYIIVWKGCKGEAVLLQTHYAHSHEEFTEVGKCIDPFESQFLFRDVDHAVLYSEGVIRLTKLNFDCKRFGAERSLRPQVLKSFECPGMLSVRKSLNRKRLVALSEESLIVWSLRDYRVVSKTNRDLSSTIIAVDRMGTRVFLNEDHNTIQVYDVEKHQMLKQKFKVKTDGRGESYQVLDIIMTWDDAFLIGYTNDFRVVIWDVSRAEKIFNFYLESPIRGMEITMHELILTQSNGSIWVLDISKITWDLQYQSEILSLTMQSHDYSLEQFEEILYCSDVFKPWKERCVVERLIMSDKHELLDLMFRAEPEVALANHFITLAVEHHMELCVEAILNAISAAYTHPRLTHPSLKLTQEIVQAALIFPRKVKPFFDKIPFVRIEDIQGQIDYPIAKASRFSDLRQSLWDKSKDYKEGEAYIAAQRAPLPNLCDIDTLRILLAANDPTLFDNKHMQYALKYLWEEFKYDFFREFSLYIIFIAFWVFFTTEVNSEVEATEDFGGFSEISIVLGVGLIGFDIYFLIHEGLQFYATTTADKLERLDRVISEIPRIKFHQVEIEIDQGVRAREMWSFSNDLKPEACVSYQNFHLDEDFGIGQTSVLIKQNVVAEKPKTTRRKHTRNFNEPEESINLGDLDEWFGGGEVFYVPFYLGWLINFESRRGAIFTKQAIDKTHARFYFEVAIIDLPKFLRIGIMARKRGETYNVDPNLGEHENEFAFDCFLNQWLKDGISQKVGDTIHSGDIIGVQVDMQADEIRMFVNDDELKIDSKHAFFSNCNFREIEGGICPTVSGSDGIVILVFESKQMRFHENHSDCQCLKVGSENLDRTHSYTMKKKMTKDLSILKPASDPSHCNISKADVSALEIKRVKSRKVTKTEPAEFLRGLWEYLELWNVIDLMVFFFVPVTLLAHFTSEPKTTVAVLASITTLTMFMNMLYYARGLRRTSIVVKILISIVVDVAPVLILVFVFVLCFAVIFHWLAGTFEEELDPNFSSMFTSFMTTFAMGILGESDNLADLVDTLPIVTWPKLFFLIMEILLLLVMLNALIAYMGDSYDRVREKSQAESLSQRAELVVEFLQNLSPNKRTAFQENSKWLHILGPTYASTRRKDWNGQVRAISGEISKFERELKNYSRASFSKVFEEFNKFKQDMHELKKEFRTLKSRIEPHQ